METTENQDPRAQPEIPRGRRKWKVWHKAVVLISVLGGISATISTFRSIWLERKAEDQKVEILLDGAWEKMGAVGGKIEAQPGILPPKELRDKLFAAKEKIDEALDLRPNNAKAITYNGIYLARRTKFEDALEEFDRAIKIDPFYRRPYYNKGLILLYQNNFCEGVYYIVQATKIPGKKDVEPYLNLGRAMQNHGLVDEALKVFLQAEIIAPDSGAVLQGLGKSYHLKGNFNLAEEAYRKWLHVDKKNPEVYYRLGEVLQKQNRLDEAITQFEKAILFEKEIDNDQKLIRTYPKYALALLECGRDEDAMDIINRPTKLGKFKNEFHLVRGKILLRQNKIDEARQEFKKATGSGPNNIRVRAWEALDSLNY